MANKEFQALIFLQKFFYFLKFFSDISYFFKILENILLLKGKLRLRACLAICLIFQENRGWHAYKRFAYKKKCNT